MTRQVITRHGAADLHTLTRGRFGAALPHMPAPSCFLLHFLPIYAEVEIAYSAELIQYEGTDVRVPCQVDTAREESSTLSKGDCHARTRRYGE